MITFTKYFKKQKAGQNQPFVFSIAIKLNTLKIPLRCGRIQIPAQCRFLSAILTALSHLQTTESSETLFADGQNCCQILYLSRHRIDPGKPPKCEHNTNWSNKQMSVG